MARIFITGSTDGLGQMSARLLIKQGHQVVLHARNNERAQDAMKRVTGAETIFIGDLRNIDETKDLARQANESGYFDAVIHNAGVYQTTPDEILAVNTIAPYVLTSLMTKPKRLVYLSSGMHIGGKFNADDIRNKRITYSDSKLHVLMLTLAIARLWPDVLANAVDPGWVPTKMGGRNAPDNLEKGYETQCWLAGSNEPQAKITGHYLFHKKQKQINPVASDITQQEKLLATLEEITQIKLQS